MADGLKTWSVYIHITPSDKYYVGITSQSPDRRWRNGDGYKNSTYFYNAILKYGWDNIDHIILFENLSEKEVKQYEKDLISFFQTNNRQFGYNCTVGGDGVHGWNCPQWRKDELSVKMSGSCNHMYGVHLSGKYGKENPMYGKPSAHRKKVECVTTGEIFDCVTHGAVKYNTYRSDINKAIIGGRKFAGKLNGIPLEWRYI